MDNQPACQRIRPALGNPTFVGRIVKIVDSDGHMMLNGDCVKTLVQTVTLKVVETFAGGVSGEVLVHAGNVNGIYFSKHGDYLVFAKHLQDGSLTVTGCGGTKRIEEAKEDLAYLRSWASLPKTAKIFGYAVQERDDPRRMIIGVGAKDQIIKVSGPVHETLKTDHFGAYRLENVPPGTYTMELEGSFRGAGLPQVVDVVERGCAEVNFHFYPEKPVTGKAQTKGGDKQ
jgi:hypothetical protein